MSRFFGWTPSSRPRLKHDLRLPLDSSLDFGGAGDNVDLFDRLIQPSPRPPDPRVRLRREGALSDACAWPSGYRRAPYVVPPSQATVSMPVTGRGSKP
jgi:hypothetical protein